MLQLLIDYGVPLNLIFLMLVSGTEVHQSDFAKVFGRPRAVLLGAAGQLMLVPPLAFFICTVVVLPPAIAAGVFFLALSPGGGISSYYCYLARANVLLSAVTTTLGTFLSLLTIPLWLIASQKLSVVPEGSASIPYSPIVVQLIAFMIVPMAIGIILRHLITNEISRSARVLRVVSTFCVTLVILILAIAAVRDGLIDLAKDIVTSALSFVLAAMLLGRVMSYGLRERDRPVLVIESGVRNVGVGLLLGSALLEREVFGIFAAFLTGYFIVEVLIMVTYAAHRSALSTGGFECTESLIYGITPPSKNHLQCRVFQQPVRVGTDSGMKPDRSPRRGLVTLRATAIWPLAPSRVGEPSR
jgi:BASS family bile acid:Na+ symporter